MKKLLSVILSLVLTFLISITAFAAGPTSERVDQLSVSAALSDAEIVNFLIEHDELNDLYQIQKEIQDSLCNVSVTYAREVLGVSDISVNDVQSLNEEYNLQLPNENISGIVDNGTVNIQRDSRGVIIDVWYLYYSVSSGSFSVKAALIDSDNPLDSVSGTITRYYLNNSTWNKKDSKSFSKSAVTNGTVYTWAVAKWGVKEKFEYDITVIDNGSRNNYDNVNENNYTRYNFEAKPYNRFGANGGQRHHFVPSTSLSENSFNSNTAYCIRMMTEDHKKTGSYGNSQYVSDTTALLKNQKYKEALQKEVDDLKSKDDCEGIAGSLQQKYYDEVITCLIEYKALFGIN